MNWSGGYKNRFRPRSDILCRKITFQQQSRIILVDNVSNEIQKTSQHTSVQKQTEKVLLNLPTLDEPHEEKPQFVHPQLRPPFSNIPYGSSSDSEDSDTAAISDTNYSPYSDLDAEPKVSYTIDSINQNEQNNDQTKEDAGRANREIYIESHSESPETIEFNTSSSSECESFPSYYPNPKIKYSPPAISFLTPIIRRRNNANLSTPLATNNLCSNNTSVPPIAYSTSVHDTNIIQATPVRDQTFSGTLPNLENNQKTPVQSNRLLFLHSPVRSPDVLISVQRKQVRFATDQKTIGQCSGQDSDSPLILTENQLVYTASSSITDKTADEQLREDTCLVVESNEENIAQELPNYRKKSSDSVIKVPADHTDLISFKRGKKRLFLGKNTPFSFNKFKKFHAPCHCRVRTVVRKVKIRDAGTQTSP